MSLARSSSPARPHPDRADALLEVLLSDVRLGSGRYACSNLGAPWAIAWKARPGAIYHFITSGRAWLHSDGERIPLSRGDLVVLPEGRGHALSAGEHLPPTLPEVDFEDQVTAAVVRRGGPGARTRLVCGELLLAEQVHPLLEALPTRIHLRLGKSVQAKWIAASFALLASESERDRLGARAIAARLAEVVFVEAVRHALAERRGELRGLLAGLGDPILREALLSLHQDVIAGRSPTVASLARRAGLSRSLFAQRFTALVGEPPIAYATRVRLHHAAQLLRRAPHRSVADIGSEVGYASEAAFSRAFTRLVGTTPSGHRRRVQLPRNKK